MDPKFAFTEEELGGRRLQTNSVNSGNFTLIQESYIKINETEYPSVKVEILLENPVDEGTCSEDEFEYSWECIDFSPTELTL